MDRVVGDLDQHLDLLLFELLDGRPLWDLAARRRQVWDGGARPAERLRDDCARGASKQECLCDLDLSRAGTERGQPDDWAPVLARTLCHAADASPPEQRECGGQGSAMGHSERRKHEISEGKTKNAARDWGFFAQFETPRLAERVSFDSLTKNGDNPADPPADDVAAQDAGRKGGSICHAAQKSTSKCPVQSSGV